MQEIWKAVKIKPWQLEHQFLLKNECNEQFNKLITTKFFIIFQISLGSESYYFKRHPVCNIVIS